MIRVQRRSLPDTPRSCPKRCIYAVAGVCDMPRINKGNSDAYCHTRGNKAVLSWLTEITATDNTTNKQETQNEGRQDEG